MCERNIVFNDAFVCYDNVASEFGELMFGEIKPFVSFFGGLGVACWPLVPKFAGSNPAEAVGFLRV
jgi:hypothetical protein